MADLTEVRVVIVDDDPLVRAGLTMMLDGAGGIHVVSALTDAGLGKLAPAQLGEALTYGSGSFLPLPAPARGLFLLDIYYK